MSDQDSTPLTIDQLRDALDRLPPAREGAATPHHHSSRGASIRFDLVRGTGGDATDVNAPPSAWMFVGPVQMDDLEQLLLGSDCTSEEAVAGALAHRGATRHERVLRLLTAPNASDGVVTVTVFAR